MPPVFSYGSNGTAQLRARVQNPALVSRPACVHNYARVFCLRSRGWGGGGVASLAPCPGARTLGSVVDLTPAELELLDGFEGGYSREQLVARVGEEDVGVIAYLANGSPRMTELPSEQYLTAIHAMVRRLQTTLRRFLAGLRLHTALWCCVAAA